MWGVFRRREFPTGEFLYSVGVGEFSGESSFGGGGISPGTFKNCITFRST